MTESATTKEITYNRFAKPLSEALIKLDFVYSNTIGNIEQWEKMTTTHSTQVDIDYVTGKVSIRKYDLITTAEGPVSYSKYENRNYTLKNREAMLAVGRYLI